MQTEFITNIILPISAGFIGILLHTMSMVIKPGAKQSLYSLVEYVDDNVLTFVYSVLSYGLILLLWYYEGLEFFGMVKGQFTYLTIALGYGSQQIFDKIVYRMSSKIDQNNGQQQ